MKKSTRVRYKYLARLIWPMICIVIALVCVLVILWVRSYRETVKTVEAHYESVISGFTTNFGKHIRSIKKDAVMLYNNSRSPLNVLYNPADQGNMELDKTVVYELQKKTGALSELCVSEYGIIFHDIDHAVNRIGSFSIEKYQNLYLLGSQQNNASVLSAWFETCSFQIPNLRMLPLIEKNGEVSALISYSANYGKNQDEISMCYLIAQEDYFSFTGQDKMEDGTVLYVTDTEGQVLFTVGAGKDGKTFIPDFSKEQENGHDAAMQRIYSAEDKEYGLRFYLYLTDTSLQAEILRYYERTKNFGILFAVILIMFFVLAIYIEYQPIHQVTAKLDQLGKDEIQSIKNALDIRSLRIQEQEDLIMDSLLNHLVYGVPFPQKVGRNVSGQNASYRIHMLSVPDFTVQERDQLSEQVFIEFTGKLYVNDLPGKGKYVLFSVIESDLTEVFDKWLREYTAAHFGENCVVHAGKPVSSLSEIRESYVSCYDSSQEKSVMAQDIDAMNLEKQHTRITKKILEFIDQNFTDVGMSQTMVADALHVSNYTISRLFRSQIGIGFSEYVNGKRLAYAKEQLLETNLPINEVALQAGFENARYFSKLFKASFNVAPSDFRKQ